MDPDAALTQARQAAINGRRVEAGHQYPPDEAWTLLMDAFEALDGWLSKGGFLPSDWTQIDNMQAAVIVRATAAQLRYRADESAAPGLVSFLRARAADLDTVAQKLSPR